MKRLQSSSRLAVRTSSAWSLMYSETAPPVPAAPLGQRRQQRAVADQLEHRSLEAGPPDRVMLPPEHLEAVPDFVLQIEELALEGAPVCQQKSQSIARLALDVDVAIPARANQLRHPMDIVRVGLVLLRLERRSMWRASSSTIFSPRRSSPRCSPDDKEPAPCDTPEAVRVALDSVANRLRLGGDARLQGHAVTNLPRRRFYLAQSCVG